MKIFLQKLNYLNYVSSTLKQSLFYILFIFLTSISVSYAQPANYAWIAEFDGNYGNTRTFVDGAANSTIRSLTVQADSNDNEYVIEWDSFNNKWQNGSTPFNSEFTLFHGLSGSPNGVLSTSATSGNYYTFQIDGLAYSNRVSVVMETDNAPIGFAGSSPVTQNLITIYPGQDVIITVNLSGGKSVQEKAFVRYSSDGFITSKVEEVTFATGTASSGTATIPGSENTAGTSISYYVYTTTVSATNASNHNLITLDLENNGGSDYSYTVENKWTTAPGATNWTTASSWDANAIPPAGVPVLIEDNLTLDQDATVSSIELAVGISLTSESGQSRVLTIQNNGAFSNGGTFSANDGSINFSGTGTFTNSGTFNANQGTISSSGGLNITNSGFFNANTGTINLSSFSTVISSSPITFNNVNISAGVNFGTNSTIDGNLTIETGGFVDTNRVSYTANSTLIYSDDNNTYGRGLEWSTTSGPGFPHNVIIRDNTTLDLGNNGPGTPRRIAGNLTVQAGSTLSLNNTPMTRELRVNGNFTNNGTVNLSSLIGGDLVLLRNFIDNGTFNANGRALFFLGGDPQTLNSIADPLVIDFLIIDKTSNKVTMLQNLDMPGNLTLTKGNLDLGGKTLKITGDIRPSGGTGKINGGAVGSTLVFADSASDRSLEVGDLLNNTIRNLTINESESITIDTDLIVTGTLDVNAGDNFIEGGHVLTIDGATLDVDPTAKFTFKSNPSTAATNPGSAQLETINNISGTSFIGDVTVERFVPAGDNNKRAYRLLTSTVNSSGVINDDWQEGAVTTALGNGNPNPGYGIHITGGSDTNGFDQNGSGNPSVFTFDNSFLADQSGETQEDAWTALDDSDNPNTRQLVAGEPYLTFVRGNRSADLNDNDTPPTNTRLRVNGTLFKGSLTYNVGNTTDYLNLSDVDDFFSLVANPYQAVIDYNAVDKVGLTNFIYVWDASVGGTNGRGAYVTVELPVGDNDSPPSGPNSSDANNYLAPGQAFFVKNDSDNTTSAEVIFEEDVKTTGENEVTVFNTYPNFYINSRLYKSADLQNGNSESDAIGLRFSNSYTTLADDEDAGKLFNPGENYTIVNNGLRSIDKQVVPTLGHEIELSILNYGETNYSLTFVMENKPTGLGVFIVDNYLNTQTEITESFVYDFTVDENIPESIASDRFSLIFDNTTLGVDENTFGSDFSLYPNPSINGQFSIKTPNISGDVNVEITSLLGQNLFSKQLQVVSNQVEVNAQNLSTGIYVVRLTQGNQSFSTKLIVE